MNEIRQHLERVRKGWVQRCPEAAEEARAAYWHADGSTHELSDRSFRLVNEVACELFPKTCNGTYGILMFNDAYATQAEVEMVLEKAAIRLDEQEGLV